MSGDQSRVAVPLNVVITPELLEALAPALADRVSAILAGRETSGAKEWLDVDGAAIHLNCPRSRIYALTSQGALPVHKDGRRSLYRRADLDRFVEAGGAKRV